MTLRRTGIGLLCATLAGALALLCFSWARQAPPKAVWVREYSVRMYRSPLDIGGKFEPGELEPFDARRLAFGDPTPSPGGECAPLRPLSEILTDPPGWNCLEYARRPSIVDRLWSFILGTSAMAKIEYRPTGESHSDGRETWWRYDLDSD